MNVNISELKYDFEKLDDEIYICDIDNRFENELKIYNDELEDNVLENDWKDDDDFNNFKIESMSKWGKSLIDENGDEIKLRILKSGKIYRKYKLKNIRNENEIPRKGKFIINMNIKINMNKCSVDELLDKEFLLWFNNYCCISISMITLLICKYLKKYISIDEDSDDEIVIDDKIKLDLLSVFGDNRIMYGGKHLYTLLHSSKHYVDLSVMYGDGGSDFQRSDRYKMENVFIDGNCCFSGFVRSGEKIVVRFSFNPVLLLIFMEGNDVPDIEGIVWYLGDEVRYGRLIKIEMFGKMFYFLSFCWKIVSIEDVCCFFDIEENYDCNYDFGSKKIYMEIDYDLCGYDYEDVKICVMEYRNSSIKIDNNGVKINKK